MKEVFRFNYDNIEYRVIKDENKYIPCKIIEGKCVYELSEYELGIVNIVFNQIKLTNNQIELPNYKYLNKEYKHFYDKTNNYHIFLNLDGSDLEENEFTRLNMLFNYQSDIIYSETKEKINIKESKLKRLVNIGKKTLLVLALSTSFIGATSSLTGAYASEIKIEEKESEELTSYQKIENLTKAIKDNKNLDKEEKEFILDTYKNVIYDNIDLIDYDLVKERFESLDINYVSSECSKFNVAGWYKSIDNVIELFNCENFDVALLRKKTVMEHELFHVLQGRHSYPGIYEPLNNIFVDEYVGKEETDRVRYYTASYYELNKLMYVLMEVVNPEALRYYNFIGDDSKLKEELMSIIDDESMYYDLIFTYNNVYNSFSNDNMTNRSSLTAVNSNKVIDYLDKYYTKKYGESIYTNIEIVEDLYPSEVNNNINIIEFGSEHRQEYLDYYEGSDNVLKDILDDTKLVKKDKIYLNNKYKETNNETKIILEHKLGYTKEVKNDSIVNNKSLQDYITKNKPFSYFHDYSDIISCDFKITSYGHGITITKDKQSYYLNSSYAQKIYDSIERIYTDFLTRYPVFYGSMQYIDNYKKNYKENIKVIECHINGDILTFEFNNFNSSHVEGNSSNIQFRPRELYNINIKTGNMVTLDEIMNNSNIKMDDITNSVLDYLENEAYKEMKTSYSTKELEKMKEKDMNRFVKSGYKNYYLDKEGNLCFDVIHSDKKGETVSSIKGNYTNKYLIELDNVKIGQNNRKLIIKDGTNTYKLNSSYAKEIIKVLNRIYLYSDSKNDFKNIIECNINNDILTIKITDTENEIFNIDLKTGKMVTLDRIMNDLNITIEDIINDVSNNLEDEYKELMCPVVEEDGSISLASEEDINEMRINDMDSLVRFKKYYLDKEGNLCFDILRTSITTNYSYNTNITKTK